MLGARLEDEITYEAPGGAFRYRVVGFEPAADRRAGAAAPLRVTLASMV